MPGQRPLSGRPMRSAGHRPKGPKSAWVRAWTIPRGGGAPRSTPPRIQRAAGAPACRRQNPAGAMSRAPRRGRGPAPSGLGSQHSERCCPSLFPVSQERRAQTQRCGRPRTRHMSCSCRAITRATRTTKIEWWYYTGNVDAARRPPLRVPAHVLPRRRRSRAAQPLALGRARPVHGAPRRHRRRRRALRVRRAAESCRRRVGGRRAPIAIASGTRRGRAALTPHGRHVLPRRRSASASISCSRKASRRSRKAIGGLQPQGERSPATRRTTTR